MHLQFLEGTGGSSPPMMSYRRVSLALRPPPPSSLDTLQQPSTPDFTSISKLVRDVLRPSRVSLHQVERLECGLRRRYLLRLTDGSALVLELPPSPSVRLLRHEQHALQQTAATLAFLRASGTIPVPRLLRHEPASSTSSLRSPYILLRPLPGGIPLSQIAHRLSPTARAALDRSLGAYLRRIANLTSTTFGPIEGSGTTCHPTTTTSTTTASWRRTFLTLLESLLRDAEDMLISLPYDLIRQHVGRRSGYLDSVRTPRLVLPHARRRHLVDPAGTRVLGLDPAALRDALWGDPLLMLAPFHDDRCGSEAFWEGWGGRREEEEGGRGRRLLYDVYRSILAITTHYYRPQRGDEEGDEGELGELEARRLLTSALNELATTAAF